MIKANIKIKGDKYLIIKGVFDKHVGAMTASCCFFLHGVFISLRGQSGVRQ
jgi:uncharacterized protein (UPF0276 family)